MKPSFHASVSVNPTHYGSGETLERKVPESQDKQNRLKFGVHLGRVNYPDTALLLVSKCWFWMRFYGPWDIS